LPPGVVLSDPNLAGLIAGYTPQHPYWTPRAFLDEASNDELISRWREALAFYPNDPGLTGTGAKAGIYGAENQFCQALVERRIYQPLKRAGLLKTTLCRETLTDEQWLAFVATAKREAQAAWHQPSYRLDYVVFDRQANETLPTTSTGHLEPVGDTGRYAVYRLLQP
jgi:hypothetical protein